MQSLEKLNFDTHFLKIGILIGIGVLFSGFFGWALRSYLGVDGGSTLWIVAGYLIGFLIVVSLQSFFLKNDLVIAGAVFLEVLAMSLDFLDELSWLLFFALILTG